MLKVTTQYPIIDNGKVIANGERCLNKCSKKEPFLYQPTEYSNAEGSVVKDSHHRDLMAAVVLGVITGVISNWIFFKYFGK